MMINLLKQKGAALIVSLLLLIAITLLAVASMQGSNLQERMASNLYDAQLTHQQTEAALLEAEAFLQTAAVDPVTLINNNGVYNQPLPAATERWLDTNTQWITAIDVTDGMVMPARYIIEYMGDWVAPLDPDCDSATTISTTCLSPTFRITAQTLAPDGRAAMRMQSIWRR